NRLNHQQAGAVSIFVVIFSALLITVVTVSFVQIMLRDQQQASITDLSTSAYDSAQAGVEDAKRALVEYQVACAAGTPRCAQLAGVFNSTTDRCDTLARAGVSGSVGAAETMVQQHAGDEAMDQAYTCVNVTLNTPDYLGRLDADSSKIVPLKGVSSFNRIKLSWFTTDDYGTLSNPAEPASGLPLAKDWDSSRPPIMRTQFIKLASNARLESFDSSAGSSTLFMYPQPTGVSTANFALDSRNPAGKKNIQSIDCGAGRPYACSVTVNLGGSVSAGQLALLRLTALYNATHFKVELYNGSTLINMDGVQPEVDSTGRANDLFRRVKSRIELADTDFPYPEAALYSTKDICKAFRVTDENSGYHDGGCQP